MGRKLTEAEKQQRRETRAANLKERETRERKYLEWIEQRKIDDAAELARPLPLGKECTGIDAYAFGSSAWSSNVRVFGTLVIGEGGRPFILDVRTGKLVEVQRFGIEESYKY